MKTILALILAASASGAIAADQYMNILKADIATQRLSSLLMVFPKPGQPLAKSQVMEFCALYGQHERANNKVKPNQITTVREYDAYDIYVAHLQRLLELTEQQERKESERINCP